MKGGRAACVTLLALCLTEGGLARGATEDSQMGVRVQALLRAHQAEVYGCVQAEKAQPEGELLLRVGVGEEGRAALVEVLKDQSSHPGVGRCLVARVRAWDLASLGAAPGDQVVFPLTLKPEARVYFSVAQQPIRPLGRGQGRQGSARALICPKAPAGAAEAACPLELVRLGAGRQTLLEPGSWGLYVVRGALVLRPLPPAGKKKRGAPLRLGPGEVAWVRDGQVELEADRQGEATWLRVDLTSLTGRSGAAGGAPRDAAQGPGLAMVTLRRRAQVRAIPIGGGRGSARLLFDGFQNEAGGALDELSAQAGMRIPPHRHEGSEELLYVLSGRGITTVGGERFEVSSGDALRIPRGVEHSLEVTEALTTVQLYDPAGPEQRFKQSPPAPRPFQEKR